MALTIDACVLGNVDMSEETAAREQAGVCIIMASVVAGACSCLGSLASMRRTKAARLIALREHYLLRERMPESGSIAGWKHWGGGNACASHVEQTS